LLDFYELKNSICYLRNSNNVSRVLMLFCYWVSLIMLYEHFGLLVCSPAFHAFTVRTDMFSTEI